MARSDGRDGRLQGTTTAQGNDQPAEVDELWKEVNQALEVQRTQLRDLCANWSNELSRVQQEHTSQCQQLVDRLSRARQEKRLPVERPEVLPEVLLPPPATPSRLHGSKHKDNEPLIKVQKAWEEPTQPKEADAVPKKEKKDLEINIEYGPTGQWTVTRLSKASESGSAKAVFTLEFEEPEEDPSKFQLCVRSLAFRTFCSAVIFINAIYVGLHAEYVLTSYVDPQKPMGASWKYIELSFASWFFIELVLRLVAERKAAFSREEAPWNMFDIFLVLLSIIDILMAEFGTEGAGNNMTFARILRVFRFFRILRIVRVMRFFYSFRLMVYSVFYSIVSLLWVLLLLGFIMYFFSIFFLQATHDHFRPTPHSQDLQSDLSKSLLLHFGTIQYSIISLFMAICGGLDWSELMRPLGSVHWAYEKIFLFYIFFMIFGVLNVVIASFVDSASQISRRDRELATESEIVKNQEYAQNIKRFFHEADVDGTGTLSWEEFETYLRHDRVQAYFQSFELDVSQACELFKLLDRDDSNDVGIEEFVQGCMRMKGQARSMDVNMLLYENERMINKQIEFMNFCKRQFKRLGAEDLAADVDDFKVDAYDTPSLRNWGRSRPAGTRTALRQTGEGGRNYRRTSAMSEPGDSDAQRLAVSTFASGWSNPQRGVPVPKKTTVGAPLGKPPNVPLPVLASINSGEVRHNKVEAFGEKRTSRRTRFDDTSLTETDV